jgi:hypothetical protein
MVKVSREIAQFSPSTLTLNTYWSGRKQDGVMAWHDSAFSATLAVRRSQNPAFSGLAASGVLKIRLSRGSRRPVFSKSGFLGFRLSRRFFTFFELNKRTGEHKCIYLQGDCLLIYQEAIKGGSFHRSFSV